MAKRISSKLIVIFLLIFIDLTLTVISSSIVITAQRQHLILSNFMNEQMKLIEEVTFETSTIGEVFLLHKNEQDIYHLDLINKLNRAILKVDFLFSRFQTKKYIFNEKEIKLKFTSSFEEELDKAFYKVMDTWKEEKEYINYFLTRENAEKKEEYRVKLKEFEILNRESIKNQEQLILICRKGVEKIEKIGNYIQIISILIALFIFIILIYYILNNLYKPILEIKKIFKNMSKGNIQQRFEREQDDEFKELYNDFNDFIKNLKVIFSLEDKIILENQLDDILIYIYKNFQKFIPFARIGISYLNRNEVCITKKVSNSHVYDKRELDKKLRKVEKIEIEENIIYIPINIDNNNLGYVFFEFNSKEDINESHLNFLELIKNKLSIAFYKSFLFGDLLGIITDSLAKLADSRDDETGRHLKRVAKYSQIVASKLYTEGRFKHIIDKKFIEEIKITVPMHDIGKVSIPDKILLKPEKLTDEEFEIIKKHTTEGGLILRGLNEEFLKYNIEYFNMAEEIAKAHHEKFDGSGYPKGLKGEEIPISARICAIADVFDALSSKRPYKEAFPLDKCYKIIQELSGTHFDPIIVEAFLGAKDEIESIYEKYKEI